MKEKEAGFDILNQLPGAKDNTKKAKAKKQDEPMAKPQPSKEDDNWLSIWNDALFEPL